MASSLITSGIFRFLLPLFLLGGILRGIHYIIDATDANLGFASNLPYALLGAAILVSHSFKQVRKAMVAVAMFVAYAVIQYRLQVPLTSGTTLIELTLLALLIPVLCFLVHSFPESGVSSQGLVFYTIMLAMLGYGIYLALPYLNSEGVIFWRDQILVSIPSISKIPFALVVYCLTLTGVSSILVLAKNRTIDSVIYCAILLFSATIIFFDVQYISSNLFSLSGLLIIFYVMSASHNLAFNDRLTNIPSRHALEMELKHLGHKYAIAMLDIDHFKNFNDTYGHDVGDDVLKLVANRLQRVSAGGRVYRYGGEEFTILFKHKYSDEVERSLNELIRDIEGYKMVVRNNPSRPLDDEVGSQQRGASTPVETKTVTITISVGLSDSRAGKDPRKVIKLADAALYGAKNAGRNRLAIYRPKTAS